MPQFYKPDLGANPNDPFARDENDKLVRRSFWLDMSDRSLVLAMTNDQKSVTAVTLGAISYQDVTPITRGFP